MTELFNRTAPVTSGKYGNMYEFCKKTFPGLVGDVVRWGRYDAASIYLMTKSHQTYIFSYRNDKDWCLQTRTNMLNSLGTTEG